MSNGAAMKLRISWALAVLLGACTAADRTAQPESIFSGSGTLGVRDGTAADATFVLPAQLAYDAEHRTIYVADEGAQRIRAIDSRGTVSTIAGGGDLNASGVWVDGGYRDGPASGARFDRPAGIALASDGRLYVADRLNHCIRVIVNGTVATFAGSAANSGLRNGPRARALFADPRQLALAKDGTLFVADRGSGVRAIDARGMVSTLHVNGAAILHPTGVSLWEDAAGRTLFVADALGLVRVHLGANKAERVSAFPTFAQETPPGYPISSGVPLGVPYALAALGAGDLAFTDLRDSSVKYLRVSSVLRYLGAIPQENAMLAGGSPASTPEMHYDAPMGVASAPDGTLFVADSGNRRIVRIAPFARRATGGNVLDEADYPEHAFRIALLGLSYTWWGSLDDDSIGGLLAKKLATLPQFATRPPVSRSFIVDMPGEFETIDSVFAGGAVDLIVQLIAPVEPPARLGAGKSVAMWGPVLRAKLAHSAAAARASHIPMLVVVIPASQAFSPQESAYLYNALEPAPQTDYEREHRDLLGVLSGVDVPVLDLYPAARQELVSPMHRPLFATTDPHYTAYGRDFIAQAIFDRLQTLQL